ncbi:MAG: DUF4402 domain-containing protein [Balneolaceae bacterium]
MKTLKILCAAMVCLAFAPAANLFAQFHTDSEDATVSTFVINEMVVEKQADINFGFVSNDISVNEPLIDPTDGSTSFIAGDVMVGKFQINATDGQSIEITDNSPVTLTGPGSVTEIDFVALLSGFMGTNASDFGGTSVNTGESFSLTDNIYTVWVGGTLEGGSSLTIGEHQGTYTLTVEYVFN